MNNDAMNRLLTEIAAIITTMRDIHPQPAIASTVYFAMNMNIHRYHAVTDLMVRAGLINKTAETLHLTPLGIEKADEINAKLNSGSTTNTPPSNDTTSNERSTNA